MRILNILRKKTLKIPKQVYETLERYKDSKYQFQYELSKRLEERELLDETKELVVLIDYVGHNSCPMMRIYCWEKIGDKVVFKIADAYLDAVLGKGYRKNWLDACEKMKQGHVLRSCTMWLRRLLSRLITANDRIIGYQSGVFSL